MDNVIRGGLRHDVPTLITQVTRDRAQPHLSGTLSWKSGLNNILCLVTHGLWASPLFYFSFVLIQRVSCVCVHRGAWRPEGMGGWVALT